MHMRVSVNSSTLINCVKFTQQRYVWKVNHPNILCKIYTNLQSR